MKAPGIFFWIAILVLLFTVKGVFADTGINSCQTLGVEGERYFLTGDIADSGTSQCIKVGAKSVEFDLAGYSVDGNDVADYGFYCSGYTNVTLRNGTFSDWDSWAVDVRSCHDSLFGNLTFSSNPDRWVYSNSVYRSNFTNWTGTGGSNFIYIINNRDSRFDTINKTDRSVNYEVELYNSFDARCNGMELKNVWLDGKQVAFYNQQSGLYVANTTSENVSQYVFCACHDLNISNVSTDTSGNAGIGQDIMIATSDRVNISDVSLNNSHWGIISYYSDFGNYHNLRFNHSDIPLFIQGGDFNRVSAVVSDYADSYGFYLSSNAQYNNVTNSSWTNGGSYATVILTDSDYNVVENCTFQGFTRTHYLRSNSGKTLFPEGNVFRNNLFNYTTEIYYNPYADTDVLPNFFNTSLQEGDRILGRGVNWSGNFWAKTDGTGYSETCADADGNGFCDQPFNATTETSCSGATCGNLTDYLPLSNKFSQSIAVECGDTTKYDNWSYHFAGDSSIEDANCFDVVNSHTSLDCRGHELVGNAYGDDFTTGIYAYDVGNLSVVDCRVRNFTTGLAVHHEVNVSVVGGNYSDNGNRDDGVNEQYGVGVWFNNSPSFFLAHFPASYTHHSGSQFAYVSSCPFIYAWNGSDFVLQNEDLSPFHNYWLEGTYSSRLPDIDGSDLRIRIVERLDEVTYFDSVALTQVTHPVGTEVYKDTDGNTYAVSDLQKPIACKDSAGGDCLSVLSYEDGEFWNWHYDRSKGFEDYKREAVLTFRKEGDFAKILWNPQLNAPAMNRMYKDLLDFVGTSNYDVFEGLAADGKPYDGHKDAINTLYLWNGKSWELLHIGIESMAVNHAGKWVVPVDLTGIPGKSFNIKIVSLPLSGGADFVNVDFSPEVALPEEDILPSSVSCNNGQNTDNLFADDQRYLVMRKGDFCEVSFDAPKEKILGIGTEKTYFTKSNGWYLPDFAMPEKVDANEKNFITKPVHEFVIESFWTHDSLRDAGTAVMFPEKYVTYLSSDFGRMPSIPEVHDEHERVGWKDKPYQGTRYGVGGGGNGTILNVSAYGYNLSNEGIMESGIIVSSALAFLGGGEEFGEVADTHVRIINCSVGFVRSGVVLHYNNYGVVDGLLSERVNESHVMFYSSSLNNVTNSRLLGVEGDDACFVDTVTFTLGSANPFMFVGTGAASVYNNIFNNFLNNTNNTACVYLDGEPIVPNLFNTSERAGENIIGRAKLGGNYFANPTGNGFSETCLNSNGDEFCDLPFQMLTQAPDCDTYNSCDRLPLTGNNSCYCDGTSTCVFDCTDNCIVSNKNINGNLVCNSAGNISISNVTFDNITCAYSCGVLIDEKGFGGKLG